MEAELEKLSDSGGRKDGDESDSLSVNLEKEVYEDVYGTSEVSSFVQAEEMLEKARGQLEEALDLIPAKEKTDYMEAVKHAPHLVEIESSPVRFIRCALYNHTTAAQLLVAYWRKRKEIFGNRALLPMIQTGEGALSPEDVAVLNSGFGILLPSDAHNRIVVFHDRSRLTDPSMHSLQKRLRCLFYLLSVASECEESRTFGVVTLEDHGEESANSFDGISVKQALELIQGKVMPIRVKAVHLVMKNQEFASNVIPVTLQVLEKSSFLRQRTVVHTGKTGKALFSDLAKYGFRKDGLPLSLGGSWLYSERFTQWQAQRTMFEREGYYAARGRNIANMPLDELLQKAVQAREDEKKKRRRVMDALYARRKRERRKIETEVTEDQAKRLMEQNSDLRRKNGKLQDLMQQAIQIVAQYTMDGTNDDRKPPAQITGSANSIRDGSPSFSGTARADSFVPIAIGNTQSSRRQQQGGATQDYATADPSYNDQKPAFQSPQSNCSSLSSGSAEGNSSKPARMQGFAGQQQQNQQNSHERAGFEGQQREKALGDRIVAQQFQQELLRGELKREIKSHSDQVREGESQRQRGLLQEGERGEGDIQRQNQMFREGERREESLQQQNQALREEELRQHSQSYRQRERDDMQRQVNQTLEAEISRQNQLLRDGEVRHQNQLSRERELQRENQVLRESVIASTRRAKSAENAQRNVSSGQADQHRVSQALHQQHQDEQQALHQQQHQQQQRMHLQQQGEQQQQEKQQQKEMQQQQQNKDAQQQQQERQEHHQQQQDQHQQQQEAQQHQRQSLVQQVQHAQHQQQQQHQQQHQQQNQHQQRAQEQQSISNMISWLQGQVQAGQQGQSGPNQNGGGNNNNNSSSNNNNNNPNKNDNNKNGKNSSRG
jgi:hypothetical protein